MFTFQNESQPTAQVFTLDNDQLKADFDRDGFVIIRRFLAESELAELRRELHRYITTVVPTLSDAEAFYDDRSRPETLKQLQGMEGDPFFLEYSNNPNWTSVAETLLGEKADVNKGGEWFNKPPGTNHPTPAHQDNYYFNLTPPSVLTMWLALEDVDEENGCLRYVRGSHRDGRRPHARSNVLGFSQGITDYGRDDEAREVAMILKANDLIIHHGWTIHRADPNRSATRHRPSFAIVFRGVSCQVDDKGYSEYQQSLKDQHKSMGLET